MKFTLLCHFLILFILQTACLYSEPVRITVNNLHSNPDDTTFINIRLPGISSGNTPLSSTVDNQRVKNSFSTRNASPRETLTERQRFSFSIVENTGIWGYFNMNQTFIPGEITLGVTPSFDVRIDHYFHLGTGYMILWAKPDTTDDARFIMNANIRLRLAVPVHPNVNVEALIIGGASMWPKADTTSVIEPTFFDDRFGWNIQPALGVDLKLNNHWSLIFTAGYLANTTVLDEIYITHDMLLLSVGPRFRF